MLTQCEIKNNCIDINCAERKPVTKTVIFLV